MAYPMDHKERPGVEPGYTLLPTTKEDAERADQPQQPRRFRFSAKRVLLHIIAFAAVFHVVRRLKYHCQRGFSDADDYFATDDLNIFGADRPKPSEHHHWKHHECFRWTNETSAENSTFTYNLPIDSPHLKFISHGFFFGHVDYVLAEDDAKDIGVELSLKVPHHRKHHDAEVERQHSRLLSWVPGHHGRRHHKKAPVALVCQLKNEEGEAFGVGVFRPRKHGWWKKRKSHHEPLKEFFNGAYKGDHHHHDHPHPPHHRRPGAPWRRKGKFQRPIIIHAKVTIPKGEHFIPALESVFPTLSTHVHSGVFNDITFGAVGLVGGPVRVDAITAAKAAVISRRGWHSSDINGTFVVSDKLTIVTHNETVTPDITLLNSVDAGKPTELSITTSNATIAAKIALLVGESMESSTWTTQANGSFKISTVTSSADIVANITHQPVSSTLHLASVTKDASVSAFLPASYEGPFVLVTNGKGESSVSIGEGTDDPSGEGRERVLQKRSVVGRLVSGSVKWVEKDDLAQSENIVYDTEENDEMKEATAVVPAEQMHKYDVIERDLISRAAKGCYRHKLLNSLPHPAFEGVREEDADNRPGPPGHHGPGERAGVSLITSHGDATLFFA